MSSVFGSEPLSPKGRWIVVAVATGTMQLSYWPVVATVVLTDRADALVDAALVGGLSIVPLVCMVLAFASRHPNAPWAVLRAMGVFLVVALPLGLVHIAIGMAAGYGAAGSAALRRPEDGRAGRWRLVAVVAVTAAVTLTVAVASEVGMLLGALLPFVALGIADGVAESEEPRAA